jgi:hypothetical protein
MKRLAWLWCSLLAVLAAGGSALAQAPAPNISSLSPSSIVDGSSSFTMTLTGTNFPGFPTANDGVCFYTGFNIGKPIAPSSFGATTATITVPASALSSVPAASFSGGTFTADVFIASLGANCSTTSHISNIVTFTINQVAFTVTSPSPAQIGEPQGAFSLTLTSSAFPPFSATTNGVCFYTGSTVSPIVPTVSGNTATLTVPATATSSIPASSYTNALYTAKIWVAPTGACTAASAESNVANFTVVDANLTSAGPTIYAGPQTATSIQVTGSFPPFSSSTYGLCYYTGGSTALAPLIPTVSGSTATVSLPASYVQSILPSSFAEGYAITQFFVAPATQTCNPSVMYSPTVNLYILQYFIEIDSGSQIPAGQAGMTLTFDAGEDSTLPSFSPTTIGVCFYTGFGTSTPLIPTVDATTGIGTLNIAASTIQNLTPANYTAGYGEIVADVYYAQAGQTCNPTTGTSYSNTAYAYLEEPESNNFSFNALSQNNPALSASANPTQIQAQGYDYATNPIAQAQFTYSVGSSAQPEVPGTTSYLDNGDITATLPAPPTGATSLSVSVCNVATYIYCGGFEDPTVYALAASTGTLAASPSTLYTTQTTSLTASFAPGTYSTPTRGPQGALSGMATFTQGSTNLGSAPLVLNTATATFNGGDQTAINNSGSEASLSNLTFNYADFNKDGIPDLVIRDSTTSSFHLLLGTPPRGDYLQMNDIPTQGASQCTGSIIAGAVGDVNNDGYPDLVYLCRPPVGEFIPPSSIYVALNQGGIITGTPTLIGTTAANQIAIGDVNKDGNADIVVSGRIGTNPSTDAAIYGFATYLGNGSGATFTTGPTTTSVYGQNGIEMTLADYDQDGYPDVAVVNTVTPIGVVLLRNDHTGSFGATTATVTTSSAGATYVIKPLSTSTTYPSVLVTDSANTRVGISVNPGTGAFTAPALTYTSLANMNSAAWGDFNDDGNLDVAYVSVQTASVIFVRLGNGAGALSATNSIASGGVFTASILPMGIDQNADGYADVLSYVAPTTSGSSGTLRNYMVTGTATATLPGVSLSAGNPTVVTATTPGSVNMLGSSPTTNVTVTAPPAPTITWANPAAITYGTLLSATQLNATASNALGATVAGTFTYTPAANTLLTAGTQTLSVLFTPTDNIDYSSATKTVSIVVNQATPTVSWTMPSPIVYGTALSSTQLDATATGISGSLPGSFVYTPSAGTILSPGTQTLNVAFTPTDTTDYKNGAGSTSIVVTAPNAYTAPTTPVGTTSATQTATITITTASAGAPATVNVLTLGAPNLDYKLVSGGTCGMGTAYTVNQVCTVLYSFTPSVPGVRMGAVTLTVGTAVLGTTYLSGIGTGPLGTTGPGLISTVAGNGTAGYVASQDTGTTPATSAEIGSVAGIAVDGAGNLYMADSEFERVRKVSAATGDISTVAGNGTQGYVASQDTGTTPATSAELNGPSGVAVDGAGNFYIADANNSRVRKVTAVSGDISTVAGNGTRCTTAATTGCLDGNAATSAELGSPFGVTLDGAGNLYIADTYTNTVRKVTSATGKISTVAGNGTAGYVASQDTGTTLATAAELNYPNSVALDTAGNLYIADFNNERIRKVAASTGYISTFAGNGTSGFTGNSGPASGAELSNPTGVAVDAAGDVYIAQQNYGYLFKISPATGNISSVAGNGTNCSTSATTGCFDGGPATSGEFSQPGGVVVDGSGNLYILDTNDFRIRKVTASAAPLTFASQQIGTTSTAQSALLNNIGNTALNLTALAASNANFTLNGSTCTATGTVAAGNVCTIGVAFTPQSAGTLTGNANATDNTLNAAGSVQSVPLSGIGALGTKTIVFPQPTTPVALDATATLAATASNGDPVTYSITGGTATLSGSSIAYTNAGTVTITANSAATSTYAAATPVSVMVTVQKGTPVITWNPNPSTIASGTALSSAQLDATAAYNGTNVPGTFTYNPASGTILSPGIQMLGVSFAPTDTADYNPNTGSASITVTSPGSNTAPTTPVGSTSATQTVSLTVSTAGTIGSINVLTQGAPNLDFKLVSGGTCAVGTAYTANQVCTVLYAFTPTTPGTRLGGITLAASGGSLLSSTYLAGLGTGPLVTFPSNNVPAVVDGGLTNAEGLALDGSGNVFLADYNGAVYELQASNGYALQSVGTGFNKAFGIAVDGIGNLFVADTGGGQVDEVFAASGYTTQTPIGTGVSKPSSVAVDGKGNVYVADLGLANVRQFTAASGYTAAAAVGSGFTAPAGIAVDGSGNVFVADKTLSKIFEVTAASGYATVASLGSGFSGPTGVTVDDIGDVFVADGNAIKEILAQGGYTTVNTLATGYDGPGLGLDRSGNLFFTTGGTTVYRFKFGTAPTLNFPSTAIPTTSPVQTVSVANEGNALLTFTALAGTNPSAFPESGTCTATGTLTSGSSCTVGVAFSPVVTGSNFGIENLTDNTLNAAGTIQSIQMTGVGLAGTKTITFAQPATPVALGATATLTATASNGDPVTYSINSGTASIVGSTITYTNAGTVTIVANSAATSTYAAALPVAVSVSVQQGTPVITWTPNPSTIAYGTALSGAQLDATATYNSVTVPGTFTYTPAIGTVLSPGSQTLNVSFTPTDTADYTSAIGTAGIVVNSPGNAYTAPTTPVGTTSATQTANVSFNLNGTIAAINVLTQGAPNLDYKLVSGGSCAVGTAYTVGQVCSVEYSFTPSVPGTRLGGITLTMTNSAGVVLGNSYLTGIGTGPQVTFVGNTAAATLNGSFNDAAALAQDGSGNLFVLDGVQGTVKELTAASGYSTALLIASGLSAPNAAAVDGFGNLFVANLTGRVDELLAAGGYTTTTAVGPANDGAGNAGVAIDGSGNLYVSRFGGSLSVSSVVRYTAASGYTSGTSLGSGFNTPEGLAVDASGNVFVADYGNSAVKEITAASGYTTVNTLGSNIALPRSVSLDASGNVFVANGFQLKEILAAGGYTTVNAIAPNSFAVETLVDGHGNIFGVDDGATVFELNLSTPSPLAFPSTNIGSTSATQSVTVANDGNAVLTFTGLASTNAANFPLTGSTCTATGALAAGASCTIGVAFSPQSTGTLTGNANATDNNLNVLGSIQSIPLTGTSGLNTKTITFPQPTTPVALNATATLAATASNSDPVSYSVIGGTATIVGSQITYTSAGPVTIAANSAATSTYAAAAQVTRQVVVQQSTPAVTWSTPGAIVYGVALSATQLDATASVPGTFAYTPAAGTVLTAGTQTLSVLFTPTDTTDYTTVTQTVSLIVNKANPTVTWATPAGIAQGTPLSATQLDATASVPGAFTYTPPAGTVLPTGTTTLSVLFTPTDTVDYSTATKTVSQVVGKSTPTVTWSTPAAITYGTALSATQLNASASVPGTFAYTPAAGTVPTAGTQTLSVLFTPTDTTDYTTATQTVSLVVNQAAPTVTWPTPSGIVEGTPLSAAQLDASATGVAGSALPGAFTYTPPAGTILGAGTQTLSVLFTPTDAVDYTTASKTVSLVVGKAAPTVTWSNPAAIAYGTALSATQLNATASVPGAFVYTPAAGTVLTAGTQTLSVLFTPTDAVDYTTATQTVSLVVTKATPTVTWNTPASIVQGTALSATQLNATASVPGTFVYTPAAGTVLSAGTQTLSVLFTPTDTSDYSTVTQTVSLVVSKSNSVVSWNTPASIIYGTALSATQLNATATIPGTFVYTPAAGTVLGAGTQTLSVVFTPTDTVDYTVVTQAVTLVVTKATPTVTWKTPAGITQGTALSAAQLNATASVPGTFVYTPPAGTVLGAGTQTLSVLFTPTDATDYSTVTQTVSLAVGKATPTVTWATPAAIGYGTALSATQLDATASVPGAFVYTPAAGTAPLPGTQTLSVLFTPTDTTDYSTVTQTVSLIVNIPTTTAGLTSSANPAQYGQPITLSFGITPSAKLTAAPTGTVTFKDGATTIGSAAIANNAATLPIATLLAGSHALTAVYSGDTNYVGSTSPILTQVVNPATTVIAWTPSVASIVYGAALSGAQLNASVSTAYASTVAGVFTYTPASGSVLTAGTQTLHVTFTPTDTADFLAVTGTATISVTQATPVLTWPTPAGLVTGTPLSSTQLDATAAGVTGAALPGSFAYTPPAGSLVSSGTQTLSVTFTPTDATDYTTASATVSLNGTALALTALSSTSALLGDPAKTITLTGAGFLPTSVVQVAGVAIPTTYVNPTTLTAVVPASSLLVVATLPVTVSDPVQNAVSTAINISVTAPPVTITFTSPGTVQPAQQPTVPLQLVNPYPVVLTGVVTLSFTPTGTGPNDPSIQFAQGGRTLTFQVQPGTTITPTIQFQSGTVAGTITLTLTLSAGGVNVTPANVQPIAVPLPQVVPAITAVSFVQAGGSVLVSVTGYSNTLQVATANFHFTAASGSTLANPDVTIPVTTLFAPYYSSTAPATYGSEFVYTQFFTLSESETISGVSVTLVNSVGTSTSKSSQ